MTHARYTFAGPAGTGRGGTRDRNTAALWLVLHTSEGGEGDNSAENLASFIRTPASNGNVASYQAITDTDRILVIMADHLRSHGAAGANDKGLHLCIPGTIHQTRNQWLDMPSGAYIEQAARWIVDKSRQHNIPLVRIDSGGLKRNERGVCDHNTVRLAFGQTTHTDCGPNFPWDILWKWVDALAIPTIPSPEDDDVTYSMVYAEDNGAWFVTDGFRIAEVYGADIGNSLISAGTCGPLTKVAHESIQGMIDRGKWVGGPVPAGYTKRA